MKTIGERIRHLRKDILCISQKEFGDVIGLKPNSISCIETGTNAPTEQNIKSICREFKVRYQWLTEGIEPMYEELDSDCMTRIDAIMTGENEFAKSLFKAFSRLDTEEWKLLEKLISDLKKNEGE